MSVRKPFPEAEICFDAFRVSQLIDNAIDSVMRAEVKLDAALKALRWGLLKSPKDGAEDHITDMHWRQHSGLKTARAWRKQRGQYHRVSSLFCEFELNGWVCGVTIMSP